MSLDGKLIRSDAVVSRLIGGETLVVPVRGGVGDLASIYSFNAVGTTIWEAARQSGIAIPVLCHDPRLQPVAVCRVCAVEVKGARARRPVKVNGTHQRIAPLEFGESVEIDEVE